MISTFISFWSSYDFRKPVLWENQENLFSAVFLIFCENRFSAIFCVFCLPGTSCVVQSRFCVQKPIKNRKKADNQSSATLRKFGFWKAFLFLFSRNFFLLPTDKMQKQQKTGFVRFSALIFIMNFLCCSVNVFLQERHTNQNKPENRFSAIFCAFFPLKTSFVTLYRYFSKTQKQTATRRKQVFCDCVRFFSQRNSFFVL